MGLVYCLAEMFDHSIEAMRRRRDCFANLGHFRRIFDETSLIGFGVQFGIQRRAIDDAMLAADRIHRFGQGRVRLAYHAQSIGRRRALFQFINEFGKRTGFYPCGKFEVPKRWPRSDPVFSEGGRSVEFLGGAIGRWLQE